MSIRTARQAYRIRVGIAVGRVAVRKHWAPTSPFIEQLLRHPLERRAYREYVRRNHHHPHAACWCGNDALEGGVA